MSRTDLIADTLTIIRNGLMAKKNNTDVPYSKVIESILNLLKEQKYIDDFKVMEYSTTRKQASKHKLFRVYLRYISGTPAITNLKRISKPGLRIYVNKNKIPRVLRGRGVALISTSKGIITDEQARQQKIGGEVICFVW